MVGDEDGDSLTLVGVASASSEGGLVALAANTVTYTPPTNYSGMDTFTYTVSDGNGGTDTASVTLTVTDGQGGSDIDTVRVFVRNIEVIGNSVFSDAEIAEVTAPYRNREITTEDLEALRLKLEGMEDFYRRCGLGRIVVNQKQAARGGHERGRCPA